MACPSVTTCEAVGGLLTFIFDSQGFRTVREGVLVTITNGTPGTAQVIPGTYTLNRVACPSATACQAVGYTLNNGSYQGVVVAITKGTPGTAQVVSETSGLYSAACPSATTCEAAGDNARCILNHCSYQGLVVPITNGNPGIAQVVPGTGILFAVACLRTATPCEAVGIGAGGVAVTIT